MLNVCDFIQVFVFYTNHHLNSGEILYCIFIDYEKCFDKIGCSFLWQKLLVENVSSRIVKANKSMYNTVKLRARYKSSFSQFFSLILA